MLFTIFSVFYVLIAAAMIILILLQRGAGANAGSGFGGGASATVFGARGSASFLTRSTAALAGLFFVLSLGMGLYLSHNGLQKPKQDLGLMGGVAAASTAATPAKATAAMPAQNSPTQNAPAQNTTAQNAEVPQATPTQPAAPKSSSSSGH